VVLGVSARQTCRYLSSLDVTTGIFLSRVTRFKADRRFCTRSVVKGRPECPTPLLNVVLHD
jgi:hypothetical protein